MNVILKIKYTEDIRNSIEWIKDNCQENLAESKINIQKKKRTVLLKKENKEKN